MNFELRPGRPTDERRQLRDSASTRRQQSRNLKGEGYKHVTRFSNKLRLKKA
ncbi:hypothetical protein [Candidatus Regiella endosymbiont of Tuberolachnus salignus]|uniref:hypothetical protein n=1 Tax=Candidatus Regiella endosymbiont of Tuberolachnus salignus TaxID=3077956 RepID=UPI0030CA7AEF